MVPLFWSVVGTMVLFPCIACSTMSCLAGLTVWVLVDSPCGHHRSEIAVVLKSCKHVKVFLFTSKNKA